MTDTPTKVTFKHAAVKNIKVQKGSVTITFTCPLGEGDATVSDFGELANESFLGTVVISGRVQQTALNFTKRPPEDE